MTAFRQFILLIWKGTLMRRRHYIVTGFEIVVPLLLTFLYVYVRSIAEGSSEDGPKRVAVHENATIYTIKDPTDNFIDKYQTILFSPNNTLGNELLQRTLDKLDPEGHTMKNVKRIGLDNEELVLAYYLKQKIENRFSNPSAVALIFLNLDGNSLPDGIDYKIRLNDYFSTNLKFTMFQTYGPRTYDTYSQSNFLCWQLAVDGAFTEMKSLELLKPLPKMKMFSQRFPFPSYTPDFDQVTFLTFIPYVVIYGLSLIMPVFVKRIIDEKVNRAKELMRMMGLSDFVYFCGTICNTFLITFIIGAIMSILFTIRFTPNKAVITFSDGSLFWIFLTVYMLNALVFCMAISTFFNKAVLGAIATYLIWCISHTVPTTILDPVNQPDKYAQLSLSVKLITCLLPNCAFHWCCRIMSMFESNHVGASWSKLFVPGSPDDNFTLGMVLAMMIFSIFFYSFLYWYVDNVWPWQIGIAKNPGFLFMPSYWMPKWQKAKGYTKSYNDLPINKSHFEDDPVGQCPGIVLANLTKCFGWGASKKVAVDGLSLNIYNGHITVILGHNGAGKTTAMNVLTGLFRPTSGSALIDGYDIIEATAKARQNLGLCPQHNVLYDNLTVEEHLKFFAGLKGMSFSEIPAEVSNILSLLDLEAKRGTLSQALSGGMKRKLSLGNALIANSKVLVLDEPTSGMDPQARRAIWDMLQSVRRDRTILLTTHYMEEADILGDRIAIMAEGKIQCCGSPLFLKQAFGAGYHLRIAKGENFQCNEAEEIVKEYIPNMYIESDSPSEVCFILPTQNSDPFVSLFDDLENNKQRLGYLSCGITITTMEDVFLKVGKLNEGLDEEGIHTVPERNETTTLIVNSRLSGFSLLFQKCRGLFLKRFHDAKRYWAFLLFQILLPNMNVAIMLVILNLIKSSTNSISSPLALNVGTVFGESQGFYGGANLSIITTYVNTLKDYKVEPIFSNDPLQSVLDVGESDLERYTHKLLIGGTINKNSSDAYNLLAMYNGQPFHTQAMSLNVMGTTWLRFVTGLQKATIKSINHPLPDSDPINFHSAFLELPARILFSIFLPSALSFLSASFVLFPIHERVTKSKLIQRMTGLGGFTFWGCHFIWDFAMLFLAASLILIPFVAISGDVYGNGDGILGSLFLLILMYGWSAIPFSYIISFIAKKPSSGFVLASSISSVTGLMLTLSIGIYKTLAMNSSDPDRIAWGLRILPDFAVTWGAVNLHLIGEKNSFCVNIDKVILDAICPVLNKNWPDHAYVKCCPAEICGENCFKRESYITFGANSCGRDLLFMGLSGFLFFGILILLETNLIRFWYRFKERLRLRNTKIAQDDINLLSFVHSSAMALSEDDDVAEERSIVEDLGRNKDTSSKALTVLNLTKYFSKLCAVDHLSFSVHHHECFGLLGVNGAGKTTTFSMLTGDTILSDGNAFIANYNLKENLQEFQNFIGYCPQFDAILDRMTGREALYLFARLRGIPENQISQTTDEMIKMVDLEAHADKTAEKYSGGNRRKLSLGLSLIGGPRVVFLDEPTAGVDPAARRKIWNALINVQKHGKCSFILTTHSMEECEALCGRLAIMVHGQFRCLGSIQHLKSKFGQGYTIILKLQKLSEGQTPQQLEISTEAVRKHMEKTFFNITLKDFHQGMLHYHLMDTSVAWSQLFREMETTKKLFSLEDYLVSDTTLEQIFLAFARNERVIDV